ncbi:nucleic acid/nucleotide deaminase domain-containing protein [Kitasatospora kifunensis]|uniref:Uncharacterized protein n=1 Tax=Kitasatospora kifunensis TaxID=58351 RepID=A0A7W7VU11_KITKI|nr:nucleic acid/nucleotide deaminase domain-containing protein [Kitasatospora kifunensis]MBB4921975.1 hypothetical protein [Kitasatospora kifunensis]
MSNQVNKALADSAKKVVKAVADDGAKAVKDFYHSTANNLKKVATNTAETDAKHSEELLKIHPREPSRDELRKALDEDGAKPVYLLGDRGKVQKLTSKGPVDLTEEDRKLLGAPLKLAGANKDTLPQRPKNPHNPYAWPESTPEEKAARPRKKSTEVPVNGDELSRATSLARHEAVSKREAGSYGNYGPRSKGVKGGEQVFRSNNYAAVRVAYHDGEKEREFILVGRSSNPVHSEKVLGIPFLENGTAHHIKDLYTERAPCSESSDCSAWVQKFMPHVNVTHSIEYGPGDDSVARGNREMEDRLNRMLPGLRHPSRSPWTNFKGLHPSH